jgi:hypothetical protein
MHAAPKPEKHAARRRPPNRSGRQGPRQTAPSTSRPRSRLCYCYEDLASEPIYDDSSEPPIYDDPTSDPNLQMSSFSGRRHRHRLRTVRRQAAGHQRGLRTVRRRAAGHHRDVWPGGGHNWEHGRRSRLCAPARAWPALPVWSHAGQSQLSLACHYTQGSGEQST